MDEIKFDQHRSEALDDLFTSTCQECGALVYTADEGLHREWHARTTVRIGTEQGVYAIGTTVERASRPKPWEA